MCCLYVPLKLKIGLAWLEFTLLLNPKIQNQRCLLTKNYLSVGNSSRDGNTRDHLTCLLGHLYAGQEATVRTGHGTVDWFQIGQGICQGYMLSPCLFYLYAEYIIRNAGLDEAQTGIEIARRNINNLRYADSVKFSSVAQSCPTLCDPWTLVHQASLSITNSWSPPKPMSIESVMPSNHLILCIPLLLPSIFASIRVFSNESALRMRWPKYWSFSFNISPSNEYSGLISFRIG